MMDYNVEGYLKHFSERMDARIADAWRHTETGMIIVAADWTQQYPNHYVYIEEAMGSLFMHVYRVGKGRACLDVGYGVEGIDSRGRPYNLWYHDTLAEMLLPLMQLYKALSDASDRVKIAVGFHCFYRGERQSYEWFKQASNNGGVQ